MRSRYFELELMEWPFLDTHHTALVRYRTLFFLSNLVYFAYYLPFYAPPTYSNSDLLRNMISALEEVQARQVAASSLDAVSYSDPHLQSRKLHYYQTAHQTHQTFLKSREGREVCGVVKGKHSLPQLRGTAQFWARNVFEGLLQVKFGQEPSDGDVEPWE